LEVHTEGWADVAPLLETGAQELPTTPRRLVEASIENWNETYGAHVKAVNWSYEGTIRSEEQRNQILAEMTDPKSGFKTAKVKKIKVKVKDKLEVEVDVEIEGYLGSSGMGKGSCTECCPAPKKRAQ
jgi:hypothetical protein